MTTDINTSENHHVIFEYLSSLKYQCPEELVTSLSIRGIADSWFHELVTPPILLREVYSPPHMNDDITSSLDQPTSTLVDRMYTVIAKGDGLYAKGDDDGAINLYLQALNIGSELYDNESLVSWATLIEIYLLSRIGCAYTSKREDGKALVAHWNAKLILDAHISGEQSDWIGDVNRDFTVEELAPADSVTPHYWHTTDPHPVSALVYSNLATVCFHMGNIALATNVFSHTVNMRLQSINENQIEFVDVAVSLNNLAVALCHMRMYAEAYTYMVAANEILEELLDCTHPRARVVHTNLEKIVPKRQHLPTILHGNQVRNTTLEQLRLGPQPWKAQPVRLKMDPITAFIVSKRKSGGSKKKKKGKRK